MKLLDFFIDISVRDGRAGAALDRLDRKSRAAEAGMNRMGAGAMLATGAVAGLGVAAGLAATRGLASIISAGAGFEAQMKSVQAFTGATTQEMTLLEAEARRLGKTTMFSAAESAAAIEMLAKNGVSTQDILNGVLDATLNLSAATGNDMTKSADVLTDVMGAFGLGAEDTGRVVDLLAGAMRASKFSMNDLALAVGQGAGAFAAGGGSLEEFLTTVALMAPAVKSGMSAGTSARVMMTRLTGLTKPAKAKIEALGMEFFDAAGNMKEMPEILKELQTGFEGMSELDKITALNDIFGQEAFSAVAHLAGLAADDYEETLKRIEETSASDMAALRMEGVLGSFKELKSAIGETMIVLFSGGMDGFLEKLIDRTTVLVNKFNDWYEANKPVINQVMELAGLLLQIAVVPLRMIWAAFKAVMDAIALANGGTINWAAAIETARGFLEAVLAVWNQVIGFIGDAIGVLAEFWTSVRSGEGLIDSLVAAWKSLSGVLMERLNAVWDIVQQVFGLGDIESWADAGKAAADAVGAAMSFAADLAKGAWQGFLGLIDNAMNGVRRIAKFLGINIGQENGAGQEPTQQQIESRQKIEHLHLSQQEVDYLVSNPDLIPQVVEEMELTGQYDVNHNNVQSVEFQDREQARLTVEDDAKQAFREAAQAQREAAAAMQATGTRAQIVEVVYGNNDPIVIDEVQTAQMDVGNSEASHADFHMATTDNTTASPASFDASGNKIENTATTTNVDKSVNVDSINVEVTNVDASPEDIGAAIDDRLRAQSETVGLDGI